MMCFTTDTFLIPKSRKYNHIPSCDIRQKDIKFVFLTTKVTKCGNLHVDTLNNTKYKFIRKLHCFFTYGKTETKLVKEFYQPLVL